MPVRREQVAAALQYLGDKADLKRRYERMVSLDQPQDSDAVDMALEMGGSLVPGVGQALAARDFERARRADDEAGMAMAGASALPLGKLVGALKQYDPTMLKMGDVVEFKAKKPSPSVKASPSADDWAEKLAQSIGNQIPMRPENEIARDLLKYKNQKALKEQKPSPIQSYGVMGYPTDVLRREKQNFNSQYGLEEGKQFTKDYEVVNIDELRPTEKIEEKKVQSLMRTMREEGNSQDNPIPPIIVDSEGNILDGHNRYEAAKRIGAKQIPIIELYDYKTGSRFSE